MATYTGVQFFRGHGVHWPCMRTVQDYIDNFCTYVINKAKVSDVYVVFNRYFDYSIKSVTRSNWSGQNAIWRYRKLSQRLLGSWYSAMDPRRRLCLMLEWNCGQKTCPKMSDISTWMPSANNWSVCTKCQPGSPSGCNLEISIIFTPSKHRGYSVWLE